MCACEFQLFLRVRCVERSLLVKRQEEGRRKGKNSDEHSKCTVSTSLSHQGSDWANQEWLPIPTPPTPSGTIDRQGPTSRSTMLGLLFLRVFTAWKTSTVRWCRSISQTMLMAQKVPLRPPPFLQEERQVVGLGHHHSAWLTPPGHTCCPSPPGQDASPKQVPLPDANRAQSPEPTDHLTRGDGNLACSLSSTSAPTAA